MPLDTTNFHPQGPVKSVDLLQFYNLFTGVMVDQPVAFSNSATIGGNQGLATVPLRVYAASGQNTDLLDLYADKAYAQPSFGITGAGRHGWAAPGGSAAQDTFLSRVSQQNGHAGDTLGILVDPYLEVKGTLLTTSPGAVATRTKAGIPNDGDVSIPFDGMLVIDTANHAFYFRSGAQWRQVTGGGGGAASTVEEEFVPTAGTTTINLQQQPTDVLVVSRNGLVQSEASNHYAWVSTTKTLTFTDPFTGTERLIVAYCIGSIVPSMAGPTTSVHEEFKPAASVNVIVLSQVPAAILMVAREGVVQSQIDGNYSLAGSTLTFTDAFSGSERVVIDYASTQFTPLINSNNIADGGIATVDLADQSVTNAKLAADTARANLLVNGGFEVWQRGAGPFNGGSVYSADRWYTLIFSGTVSVSRDTTNMASTASKACAVVTNTNTTIGNCYLDQNLPSAEYPFSAFVASASLMVRTSTANAVRIGIHDGATVVYSAYHSGGGQYERLSVTLTPGAGRGVGGFRIYFDAACTAYIDNAMLVMGSVPANYAPLHPADELARCFRYYFRLQNGIFGIGQSGGAGGYWYVQLGARMAVQPTVTISAMTDFAAWDAGTSTRVLTSGPTPYSWNVGSYDRVMMAGNAPNLVAGNATWLVGANSNATMSFEANP